MEFKIKLLRTVAGFSRALVGLFCLALLPALTSAQDYQISMGDDYGAIIDNNGNLFIWGAIAGGGGGLQQILPAEVWESVAVSRTPAAEAHILAVRTNGTLWAFGRNDRGQLGDGTITDRAAPVQIGTATDWAQVAAGADFSLGLRDSGLLFAWGDNTFGQLGFGPPFNDPAQDLVTSPGLPFPDPYMAISAGNAHAHGIRADGTLWAWGSGGSQTQGGYELGILINGDFPIGPVLPTQVGNSDGWTALFSGFSATYATRDTPEETGQLWVWGTGGFLGTGNQIEKVPARVGTGTGWVAVSRSENHALALKSDGSLWGWGENHPHGELGLPLNDNQGNFIFSNFRRETPTRLEAPDAFLAVGAGEDFSAIVSSGGFLLTAGLNDAGQLANGSNTGFGQDFFATSDLGVADIVATALTLSVSNLTPGTTASGSLTLENGGTGLITDDFEVAAVLNASPTLASGTAILFDGGLSSITVTDDIGAGASITVPIMLEIPASLPSGNLFIVLQADSTNLILETNELNNIAASETSFEFLPDLIFDDPDGVDLDPVETSYDPGDTLNTTINLENAGNGIIASGTSLDLRLFLSPTQDRDDSAAIDLDAELEITLASDLAPGDLLTIDFDPVLPAGLATGSYYIGAVVDLNDDVAEQTELISDTNVVLREDGEANNVFFTAAALVEVTGIPIDEAIDEVGRVFSTSGDGTWFGQDQVFNVDGDAVQSPSIGEGETATLSTVFTDPVVITFDWRADTSSAQNTLTYSVIGGASGGSNNTISGNTAWITETRVVRAGAEVRWTYSEGVDSIDDAVFVDNLEAFSVTDPEFVVDGITLSQGGEIVESGSYVLNRDALNLSLNSRNQGTSTGPLDEFAVSIYLSTDRILDRPDPLDPGSATDVLIRQEIIDRPVAAGNIPLSGLDIDLPTDLAPGVYYIIAYIDDYSDEDGNLLPGAVNGTGQITEFTGGGFPGETNNQFVTEDPIVEIVALPDLVVGELNPEPGYYLIRELDPTTGELVANQIDFNFVISNTGLAPVNSPIRIKVLLSRDENMEPDDDFVLLNYEYTEGLTAAGSPASTRTIDPGFVDLTDELVNQGYIGERLYFGVFIDSENSIEEIDETNNGENTIDNNFIFSETRVIEAFEFDEGAGNLVTQDTTPPFDGDLPWVGQTAVTIDGVDAAMSLDIGNGEVSAFETIIDAGDSPTFVTFRWRVSSQDDEFGRDALNFYIDDFDNPVASIAGTEGGWARVSRLVSPGEHSLRWEYRKDGLSSEGLDRGWVDDFSFQVPNLIVDAVSVDDSVGYTAGDEITDWSVTIRNIGLANVPPTPSFDIQVRVSPDNTWDNGGEYILLTISDSQGLAIGESRTYSQLTVGNLSIPTDISLDASYYVGAFVDWNEDDAAVGSIPESDETDNGLFTSAASLEIAPSISLPVAIDDTFPLDLTVGGAGGWFGVDDSQIPGGASDGVDAAQSGATAPGESSTLETIVEGPLVLEFDWKVSSRLGSNFLEFSINGVAQDSISGEVDWATREYFIPAGTQELRWTYRKTGEAGDFEDAGWIDQVELTAFANPEIALTALNYTPGRYVLDVAGFAGAPNLLVGTEYLDVTLEAENQGTDLTNPSQFTVADMEVRLSTDRIYGNADDVVLGTVNQVEGTLEAGDLMRFLGPIQLGDSIPAGFYYLMAKVDANEEIAEFDEGNNIVISQNRDIEIARLPALRIANPMDDGGSVGSTTEAVDGINFYLDPRDGGNVAFDLDEGLNFFAEAPVRLRFDIQNIGLGRVEGTQIWTTEVNLRGIKREDIAGAATASDLVDAVEPSINLGSFTVQELMEGRSDAKPGGDRVEIDLDLALPGLVRLNDIIDTPEFSVIDYLWFVEVRIDSENVVEESEIVRESSPALIAPTGLPWWIVNLDEVLTATTSLDAATYPNLLEDPAFNSDAEDGFFGITGEIFGPTTAAEWEADYPGFPTSDPDNLLAYAFSRNPVDGDTVGGQFPGTYGISNFEGGEYLSIAFDIVTRATDLVYTVEAADDLAFATNQVDLLTINVTDSTGFVDLTGAASLTGDGGLIDEANVTSVLDQGYSARVTVRDEQVVGASPTRFIRIRVGGDAASAVPDP